MTMKNPCHPGVVLKMGYLDPLKLTITGAADKLGVDRRTLSNIVNGKTGISPQMALKLGKAFNSNPEFWMNLQVKYEMAQARLKVDLKDVEQIVPA